MPLFWVACSAISAIAAADGQWLGLIFPAILIIACWGWIRRPLIALIILLIVLGFSFWHTSTIRQIRTFPLAGQIVDVKGSGWIHSDTGQKNPTQFRGILALDDLSVDGRSVPLADPYYVIVSIENTDARAITSNQSHQRQLPVPLIHQNITIAAPTQFLNY